MAASRPASRITGERAGAPHPARTTAIRAADTACGSKASTSTPSGMSTILAAARGCCSAMWSAMNREGAIAAAPAVMTRLSQRLPGQPAE